ncbi:transposase [Mycolicibacterium tusciae]|uniref:transposase n=1 Tax=Mycolicibacterium tusciae TaxID=75922 RepID=UPI00068673C6|nr:transposase [Mycolicibacterium tusciae]
MLVTLLIWAWSQGVRSSRRIERACADVVSYRVICAGDGPDHVTIARFRAENHAACEQLFTEVLMLAAGLGLGRLETVALDGVKIASNASLSANRTTSGLAKAAAAEAARIAKAAAAAHEATDAAEDEMFGDDNPGSVPAELTDPAVLAKRIAEALARRNAEDTAQGPAADDGAPAAESVELERVAHDRSGRIAQAQARIDAEIAAERAERDALVGKYLARIAAGEKMTGRIPAGAQVAMAERVLAAAVARSQAKHQSWAARGRGRRPTSGALTGARRAERPGPSGASATGAGPGRAGGCRPGRHQRRTHGQSHRSPITDPAVARGRLAAGLQLPGSHRR